MSATVAIAAPTDESLVTRAAAAAAAAQQEVAAAGAGAASATPENNNNDSNEGDNVQHSHTSAGFRCYEQDSSARQARVHKLYRDKFAHNTVASVLELKQRFTTGVDVENPKLKMTIWDALMLLNSIVDDSDPDVDLPQLHHAFQTAAGCRAAFPDKPYMEVIGLIHDLGKIIAVHPLLGQLPQHFTVGDIAPVGCAFSDSNVLAAVHREVNPDRTNPEYNTLNGIYTEGCGFDQLHLQYSHDEFLYQVLRRHAPCKLPDDALYCIRFHSFYAAHTPVQGQPLGYQHLASEHDKQMLPHLQKFQRCDLYTKDDDAPVTDENIEAMKPRMLELIEEWCPGEIVWC